MKRTLAQHKGKTVEVLLNHSALDVAASRAWEAFLYTATGMIGRRLSLKTFCEAPVDDHSEFAFISDSSALSRKLLFNVSRIYIQPRRAPIQIDPFFYWKMRTRSVNSPQMEPRAHKITLLSSIFDGDLFLSGFFKNCSTWHGYEKYEHYFIRAASPGNEHALLIKHVLRWPSAIYLNLAADPGLYEVWNLGICLASGRYLSNANIDDRRAPEHVTELTKVLDDQPGVALAAAGVRISTTPNLDWEDSADCPRMFGDAESGIYSADSLFKRSGQSLAAHNLPHCMPIWRRSLHSRFGFFDEKRYGPSADWAYWLYCTSHGQHMYFDQRPLGSYLRHKGSYWWRNSANNVYNSKIIEEYGHIARGQDSQFESSTSAGKTFSSRMEEVVTLLRSGVGQEGIGLFLEALLSSPQAGQAEEALTNHIAAKYLGSGIWSQWVKPYVYSQQFTPEAMVGVFVTIVTILHETCEDVVGERGSQIRCILEFACFDLCECNCNARGLLLFAFLSHCFGESDLEKAVLKCVHGRNEEEFWSQIQSVYLFTKSLSDFTAILHESSVQVATLGDAAPHTNIVYFPQYTGNAYLDLLYEPFSAAGGRLEGTRDITHFLSVKPVSNRINILHLHWVNSLFDLKQNAQEPVTAQLDLVLKGLTRQKEYGFKLYWTIHNYLNHEHRENEVELAFRRSLYALADKVFIHHPLASCLLDWLPDYQKLCVCEHGSYNVPRIARSDRENIRLQLGFAKTDFVIMFVGRIVDYKGLITYLPVLFDALNQIQHMKLVFVGLICSREVQEWLSCHPHPRLIIKNVRLNDEELALHMQIADIGFLSYVSILTSGTLFHWFSCGRPVLAPPLGTIVAYLVNGWNGYSYSDSSRLKELLFYCASLPKQELERLEANAAKTVQKLDWRLWKPCCIQ